MSEEAVEDCSAAIADSEDKTFHTSDAEEDAGLSGRLFISFFKDFT